MSFILDALKKSELERQRQSMPGLIDVPKAAARRGLPPWAIILAALLALNALVVGVWMLRGKAPTAPSARPVVQAEPAVAPAPLQPGQSATHFSPLDAAPVYAEEVPVNDTPKPDSHRTAAPLITDSAPAAGRAARRSDPTLNEPPAEEDTEILPSINELNLTGQEALSDLHLDVHVYATRAADRFVYINMRKYHEGATLQEGPTLEHIRRDGVVLSYRGVRFLLPRQS